MERLWTPWRLEYVTDASAPASGCVFCDAQARGDAEPLTLYRGQRCFVILNKFPYNSGHLMVVPYRHIGRLSGLDREEGEELIALTRLAEMAIEETYHPHGFNMGLNLGKPAGAGVLDHVHMHIVPRWNGDTNFMSVVGDTRVLPETLESSAARLRPLFARAGSSAT